MGLLGRRIFREIAYGAALGAVLFTFVLFLQKVGRLFELLVRSTAPASVVGKLFLLVLPQALTFTLPVGVLVGILIGLSRMAADGEITGMRAAGIPSSRVLRPVLVFSLLGSALTAAATLWFTPWSIRETYRILNQLAATELTAEIQPRVFEEQFPNTILYVGDVVPGPVVRWRKIFIADLTPETGHGVGEGEAPEGPRITVAREAVAVTDPSNNRIQLSMTDYSTYQAGKLIGDGTDNRRPYYSTSAPQGEQVLSARPPGERRARAFQETDTLPLFRLAKESIDARIELHQRLALPPACVLLALVGVPLGISVRKSGKSAALVLTVSLAFFYYMGLISLIGLAREGTLPVAVAVWIPNAVFAAAGVLFLSRLEKPGDRDFMEEAKTRLTLLVDRLRRCWKTGSSAPGTGGSLGRLPLLPQLLDAYVLTSFLRYFAIFLVSFVLMTEVFTFFELLGDIIRNRIPMARVATYLFFLTPQLIYDSTPVSVMVAVLVTFGVLAKHNEVVAFRACGVSLHRLALPVLVASAGLSAALFAFDHNYVPEANRKQDAIRAEIKGRPVQTYLRPDRKWIFGQGSRIYYYRYFDANESVMGGVSVYELDPASFRLLRHVSAERAWWSRRLGTWVFENGWVGRSNSGRMETQSFQATTFPELKESPGYFLKEVKQDKQMTFRELADYIAELQQSGFDTVRLRVRYHKKFSVPLFALILAMISVPFAFVAGTRGALAGVGVSFGIAIAYWAVSQLFEQIGNVAQLPAAFAAWTPDALFSLTGMYLLARMKT